MEERTKKERIFFAGYYVCVMIFVLCAAVRFGIGILLFKILSILILTMFIFREDKTHKMELEKTILLLFGGLYHLLLLVDGNMWGAYKVLDILCCIVWLLIAVVYFVRNHNGIQVKKWFAANGSILFVMLVFVMLSVEVINAWLMWDAHVYFAFPSGSRDVQGITKCFDMDLSGVYNLYLAGHGSLGYSLWLILFQLFKRGSETAQIADISLAAISIYAFYQILRKLLGDKYSHRTLALLSTPYALSPFVLGMVGYINMDSATMYFAVIFIACSLYHYEYLELILAGALCFTKEPAVIYYVAYILVKILCEYLSEHSFRLWNLIKFGFTNIKNYFYAMPVILWGVLFLMNPTGGWGSGSGAQNMDGGFSRFNINNSLMRLKQIFLVNFNWLFWIAIIAGLIILWIQKRKLEKEVLKKLLPICAMGITVILFGFLYITYTNLRYIVPVIPAIYLTANVVIANLNIRIGTVWNVLLVILLLAQSFYAIDPVMSYTFVSMSVGDNKIYGMDENNSIVFHDDIVYNRQYIYWQKVLIDILYEAEYNGDMLLVLPGDSCSSLYNLIGDHGVSLWNVQKGKHEYYDQSEGIPGDCILIKACEVKHVGNAISTQYDGYFDGDYILYIIPAWSEIDMEFVSDKTIVKQGEVSYRGYHASYMVMSIEGVEQEKELSDGYYVVSPKRDYSLSLCTDGKEAMLSENADSVTLLSTQTRSLYGLDEEIEKQLLPIINTSYQFHFDKYEVALDVPNNIVDDNGKVSVWEVNDSEAQKWNLEKVDEYYMICRSSYALTYDLSDNSIKLMEKTGEDNQLWLVK